MSKDMPTESEILNALRNVRDPDLNRDIVELGFVKNLKIAGSVVKFDVQLTTPACPVKDRLRDESIEAVKGLGGVETVEVNMTAQTKGPTDGNRPELLKNVRHIVAVASGKGGVGKSTTTANLAVAMARMGARVGVMDADIYGPSMNMMFDVREAPVLSESKKLYPVVVNGIKIVSMAMFSEEEKPVIWRGPMASQMIQNFIQNVIWGDLDYLFIDLPPGTGDIQLTLTQRAPISGGVIVTTPQEVSILDAKKGLFMFQQVKVPVLGIVENMSYFICDNCEKKHYIFRREGGNRIARVLGLPFLGEVPIEPQVAIGSDEGLPITESHPDSASAKAYMDMAGRIASQLSILESRDNGILGDFEYNWQDLPQDEQSSPKGKPVK